MSTGTTTSPLTASTTTIKSATPSTPTMTWTALVATLVAALVSGRLSALPTVPTVTPAVVPVVQPIPQVQPNQVNPPNVQPTPTIVPSHAITLTDSLGNQIANPVESGKMFVATAPAGIVLTPVPPTVAAQPGFQPTVTNQNNADIIKISDNKFAATLRNGATLQIVITGAGSPSILSVQCNQAPQPPPPVPIVNPVVPVNPPTPTPSVVPSPLVDTKTVGVRVIILFDAKKSMTRDQITATESPKVTSLLSSKCVKNAAGTPQWHRWDKDTDMSSQDATMKAFMSASLSAVLSESLSLPVLCVENGSKLMLYEITNEASILTPLNATFGS